MAYYTALNKKKYCHILPVWMNFENINLIEIKPDAKGQTLYYFMHMKYLK